MTDFLYKYRGVENGENIASDYSIKSLLSCEAKFSTRHDFNDLFDSKINIVKPTPKQVKGFRNKLPSSQRKEISRLTYKGDFTPEGEYIVSMMTDNFKKVIDSYYFYCLSAVPNSNLMWSYYADSHKGFCIEFNRKYIEADSVSYKDDIPNISIDDLMSIYYKTEGYERVGEHIWNCLRIKLKEWQHEKEYRLNASKIMENSVASKGINYKVFKYPSKFVSSVIFGCKTQNHVKEYIIKNYPHNIEYKQAVERRNKIEIISYAG